MAFLTDLPTELLQHIISFLEDSEPPSIQHLHEEPSEALLNSPHHPIKDLSRICHRLHQTTFPTLFTNLKVSLDTIDDILPFITQHSFRTKVSTLLLHATTQALETAKTLSISTDVRPWVRILALIESADPHALTILLPPSAFEYILPYDLRLSDEWAFNIPYQLLHLSHMRDPIRATLDAVPATDQNIFQVRPWTHCIYNEGSSIRAYSTYEYFHKRGPSLLNPQKPAEMVHFLLECAPHITSFDFIAVFPFPHSDMCQSHTRKLTRFLTYMARNLKHLRIQLAPSSDNGILDDTEALGTCQRSDLWTEFENAYALLMRRLDVGGLKCLTGFTILDYKNPGLRDVIDRVVGGYVFTGEREWRHEGDGRWNKIE
ncbi:hypothetical protein OEA41_009657 [Lepraria neglecta]|uniref:F-box domain-containing protein n=1 Tax=Lepraria neglecta TaxID=209136 RepID=A0AAD9Z285_9LECA|nr:hypothetical protein OEA41_009657 [Lepraria neglecta]